MKTKKRLAMKNIVVIFVTLLIAVSMLCGQTPEVAGMPLPYFLMLILAALYAGCRIWNIRRGDVGHRRLECTSDLAVLALIAWNLLSILGKMFQDPDTGAIHYQFQAVCVILGLLYFELKEIEVINGGYGDLILYVGLIMTGRLLFEYVSGVQIGWMSDLVIDSGKAASYLMLPCLVGTLKYCSCKDRMRSAFYLLATAVGFFMLLINYNIPSLWIMTFVFLAIPVVIRPTAELVKRDMQLFFIFGVLLSNMSLLTNYTNLLQKKPVLSLEHSVYLEILLALGAVFFFWYWDRIPEHMDRDRLVLRKMRQGYLFALRLLGVVFAIFVLGGNGWATLPDAPAGIAFVKSFALPLTGAVIVGGSGWIRCLNNSGVSTLLLLLAAVSTVERMRKNHSFSKPQTAGCQLIALAFLAQTFFCVPDINVLPVYLLFLVLSVFDREKEQRVNVTILNISKEMEQNEK